MEQEIDKTAEQSELNSADLSEVQDGVYTDFDDDEEDLEPEQDQEGTPAEGETEKPDQLTSIQEEFQKKLEEKDSELAKLESKINWLSGKLRKQPKEEKSAEEDQLTDYQLETLLKEARANGDEGQEIQILKYIQDKSAKTVAVTAKQAAENAQAQAQDAAFLKQQLPQLYDETHKAYEVKEQLKEVLGLATNPRADALVAGFMHLNAAPPQEVNMLRQHHAKTVDSKADQKRTERVVASTPANKGDVMKRAIKPDQKVTGSDRTLVDILGMTPGQAKIAAKFKRGGKK
jgi:hypothetical protein